MVVHGYQLFGQVFSAQPPLFFLTLAGSMKLFGESISGARGAEIFFGLVTIAAVAYIASKLMGLFAGAVAALVICVSPGFLVYSHAVEAEGPMMAFSALALALTVFASTSRRWSLLILAGVALAAAIEIKLFAVEAFLPAIWLLYGTSQNWRVWTLRCLLLVSSAVAPIVALFAAFQPAAQWDQVVTMHDRAAAANLPGVTPTASQFKDFLTLDPGLSVLALIGLTSLIVLKRKTEAGFVSLWLGGTAAMLAAFHPLFPHHFAIMLAPMAIAAGGVAVLLESGFLHRSLSRAALPLIAVILYFLALPHLVHADRHILMAASPGPSGILARFVDRQTLPSQIIAADDLEAADQANRLVAPPLCDPSNVRLHSGYLTDVTLISATRQYRVALVLPTAGIYRQVPQYMHWLESHYLGVAAPAGNIAFKALRVKDARRQ